MANLLDAHEWDYVIGSVHFLGDHAVDIDDETDVWRHEPSAERVWRRYFEALAESALTGIFDIIAHPDLVKIWGSARPAPSKDRRFYYEPAVEAMLDAGVAMEVSTAGLRKPVGEIYPARALLEMAVDAGIPIALFERRAHARAPRLRLRGGGRAAARLRREGDRGVRAPRAADGAARVRFGLGIDTHRFADGAPADPGRRRDPARPRPRSGMVGRRRARPRGHRRGAGRGGDGRHRPALPGHRPGVQGRGLAGAAARGGRARRRGGLAGRVRRRDGDDGAPEGRARTARRSWPR